MVEPRKIKAYQSHLLNLKFNFQEANNEIRYFRRYHKEDPNSCWTKTSRQTLQGRLDMIELFLGGLERWNEARGRRDPLVEDARADFEKLREEVMEIEKDGRSEIPQCKRPTGAVTKTSRAASANPERPAAPAPLPTVKVEGDTFCSLIILLTTATIIGLSFLFWIQ